MNITQISGNFLCVSWCLGDFWLNNKLNISISFAALLLIGIVQTQTALADDSVLPSRYVKIHANGNELPADAINWSCVKDLETRLFWIASSAPNNSVSFANRTFRWGGLTSQKVRLGKYLGQNRRDPARQTSASDLLFEDWTEAVLQRRKGKFCGLSNWRVPSLYELSGLVRCESGKRADLDRGCGKKQSPIAIDSKYFPDTKKGYYWSSSPSGLTNTAYHAWAVHFSDGSDAARYRGSQHYLRLVGSPLL
jgi:hypothetical protein|tara:strand:- start:444 stop:1196 length:753 start_codon:yes stop_codon:yes gene_type:complete